MFKTKQNRKNISVGNYRSVTTLVMCMTWEHNCLFNWNWNQHRAGYNRKPVKETGLKHTCCAIGVSIPSFKFENKFVWVNTMIQEHSSMHDSNGILSENSCSSGLSTCSTWTEYSKTQADST